jgi:hypothetical protein
MTQDTWNCIYHPFQKMRVVDDEEKAYLIATGEWFEHPNQAKEAKKARENQNEQIRKEPRLHAARRKRGANLKQSSENVAEPTLRNE